MRLGLLTVLFLGIIVAASAQETFTFTDERDGQSYEAIKYTIPLAGGVSVTRSWMLENCNFDSGDGAFCYDDEPAYCEKFGKLYTFEAAVDACPEGWRIPTRKDWFLLFQQYGGYGHAGKAMMEGGESQMNVLLGGYGSEYGYYTKVGTQGNYWDSADEDIAADGVISFNKGQEAIALEAIGKKFRNSLRCIQEHSTK
jgi:uncharacterized protein (TIGR02145 family)